MERRQFIVSSTSMLSLGIAGCTGEAESGGGSGSPEAVGRAFFTAAADGDIERQEELLHPESSLEPIEEEVELTINEVEAISLEAYAEETGTYTGDDGIEQQRDRLNEQLGEIGADDYAYVSYSFETDEYGAEDGYLILVEDDSEWLIYQRATKRGTAQGSAGENQVPQVSIEYEFESASELTITHGGGDDINVSRLSIEVGGKAIGPAAAQWQVSGWDETVRTGDSLTLVDSSGTDHSGEDVTVIWTVPDGDSSSAIASREWPAI